MHSVDISEEVEKAKERRQEKEHEGASSWPRKSKKAKVSHWQVRSSEQVRSPHTAGRVLAGNPWMEIWLPDCDRSGRAKAEAGGPARGQLAGTLVAGADGLKWGGGGEAVRV